jgi:hypothetical protein
MGYLSPFLNEDLARKHGAEMRSQAAVHRQARAVRRGCPGPLERWKSRLGWALVARGLSLISQPPGGVRGRGYVPGHPGARAVRPALADPAPTMPGSVVPSQCGCDA